MPFVIPPGPVVRGAQQLVTPKGPGLLYSVGRLLDYPGRKIREWLTGKPEATGWDVLKLLELRDKPGFDPVDILAFGTEVALDPLTYLTGGLSRTGKLAKEAGKLRGITRGAASRLGKGGALTAAETVALKEQRLQGITRLRDIMKQLRERGAPRKLQPTKLEQLRAGQRGMRWMGVPLREIPGMAPIGEAYRTGLSAIGSKLAESPIGQAFLKRISHKHFIDEAGRAVPFTSALAGERFIDRLLKRVRKPEITREMGTLEDFISGTFPGITLDPVQFRRFRELADVVQSPRSKGFSIAAGELPRKVEGLLKEHPKVIELALKTKGVTEEAFERMTKAGVKIEELMEPTIGYAERILTPEAFKSLRESGRLGQIEHGMREIFGRPGMAIQRKYTGETIQALQDLFEKTGVQEFFELDPTKSLGKYLERESRARIGALHFGSVIESFADLADRIPGEKVSAYEFAKKGPIAISKEEMMRLQKLAIPKDIASESLRVAEKLGSLNQISGFVKHWRAVASLYRLAMTAPFSAYHFRNAISNTVLNWLGGVSSPVYYLQALRIQGAPWLGIKGNAEKLEKLYSLGIVGKGFIEAAKEEAVEMGTGLSPIYRYTVGTKPGEWLTKIGSWVEDNARIAHYLGKKAKGYSDITAADSVKKFLFNYDELTQFERYKLKNFVFFYTWTRNAVPLLLEQYFRNTGKMAAMMRLAAQPSTERGTIPDWMRQTVAIPSGRAPTGEQTYITGLGLPIEEFIKFDISGAKPGLYGIPQKALERMAAMLLPPLKAPIEMVTGRDFYLGKELEESTRAPYIMQALLPKAAKEAISFKEWQTPSGFKSYRADPYFLHILRNLPTSRIQNVLSQWIDPRRDVRFKIASLISGLRTANIDERLAKLNAQIDAVNRELAEQELKGEAKKFRGYYAVGEEEEKSPRVKALLKLLRQFQEERKEGLRIAR